MLETYKKLLTYSSAVTKNNAEKSINGLLDRVSLSNDAQLVQTFYECTMEALKNNEVRKGSEGCTESLQRLCFKTKLKLGRLYLQQEEYGKVNRITNRLHKCFQNNTRVLDSTHSTNLLEVYALEIQLCTATKDNKRLKARLCRFSVNFNRTSIKNPSLLDLHLHIPR